MNIIEGQLTAIDARFVIIASRFNGFIVEQLVQGAKNSLMRHGIDEKKITLVRVPGAFEMPVVAGHLAAAKNMDAIIALGAVIRGATAHFEHVASACNKGLASVAAASGIPIANGVLTVDSIEQAIERAGTKAGNKGADAAMTALEMMSLLRQITT